MQHGKLNVLYPDGVIVSMEGSAPIKDECYRAFLTMDPPCPAWIEGEPFSMAWGSERLSSYDTPFSEQDQYPKLVKHVFASVSNHSERVQIARRNPKCPTIQDEFLRWYQRPMGEVLRTNIVVSKGSRYRQFFLDDHHSVVVVGDKEILYRVTDVIDGVAQVALVNVAPSWGAYCCHVCGKPFASWHGEDNAWLCYDCDLLTAEEVNVLIAE